MDIKKGKKCSGMIFFLNLIGFSFKTKLKIKKKKKKSIHIYLK